MARTVREIGSLKVGLIFILGSFIGCQTPPPKFNLTLLIDCSSSMEHARTSLLENITEIGEEFCKKAYEGGGGVFEILVINTGIDDTISIFKREYPEFFRAPTFESKKKWEDEFIQSLKASLKSLPYNTGSAVWEAIFIATKRLNEQEGDKVLVIYSDLRQHTPGRWNFEKKIPEGIDEFIEWAEEEYLVPEFEPNMEVVVCGFSPLPANADTLRTTPRAYGRLGEFWKRLFEKYGIRVSFRQGFNIQELIEGGDIQ